MNFPHLVEVAVFDGVEGDGASHKVYECVNFMAVPAGTFDGCFNIRRRLAEVGIRPETPVTVLVHYVAPRLTWLNIAKSQLYSLRLEALFRRAFDKLLPVPKIPKQYIRPNSKKLNPWIPRGTPGKTLGYEDKLLAFSDQIRMINARRIRPMKYSTRGWCYIVEGQGLIDKDEFDSFERAFNDCRRLGFLPIDFVAEDQDRTRHFESIQLIMSPSQVLDGVVSTIKSMLTQALSKVTDYWAGEKYYPVVIVEKGDIRNLFEPITREYHIPIASSKGWAPLHLRNDIVELARMAEKRGLKPVLLLFYDHDPAGLKITETFWRGLRDIQGATGWDPSGLIIERFGLNQREIEEYGLTWIPNLKTSSGREAEDPEYVARFGRRKCESNALFRSDETVLAGEWICRRAIEKYLGVDALNRFRAKEEASRKRHTALFDDPLWSQVESSVASLKSRL